MAAKKPKAKTARKPSTKAAANPSTFDALTARLKDPAKFPGSWWHALASWWAQGKAPANVPKPHPDEINDLLADTNATSAAANHAWLAFLALLAYLLVTLNGVSSKALLLNDPVTLPIVNVQIPLFSFFQWAPVLLLLVYLSLIIQHHILERKYCTLNEAIANDKKAQTPHLAREQVHSYAVSQSLAGPQRGVVTTWLMRLMVFVTFAVLPILTLLYFQIKFIPYHDVWITYSHRIALILGLVMLFFALPIVRLDGNQKGQAQWPEFFVRSAILLRSALLLLLYVVLLFPLCYAVAAYWHDPPDTKCIATLIFVLTVPSILLAAYLQSRPSKVKSGMQAKPARVSLFGIALAALILEFSWLVATVPDEGIEAHALGFVPPANAEASEQDLLNPIVRFVYDGIPRAENSKDGKWGLRWLLKYRVLIVEDQDLVRDADDPHNEVSRVLRNRDLRFARLSRSDLHRADFTEAKLEAAILSGTRLEKSKLERTELQGARLKFAQLQGADLREAKLQGADLLQAELQGADLQLAQLQGAYLRKAELQGANLREAKLQGANLSEAELQGADLTYAQLQGTNLSKTELQGADLHEAKLQGADLSSARLQGADLHEARLQGANLSKAKLRGADLTNAGIWLADFPDGAQDQSAPIGLVTLDQSPLTDKTKAALTHELTVDLTDAELRKDVMVRLEPILQDDPPTWRDERSWREYLHKTQEPSPEELAGYLADLACEDSAIAERFARRAMAYSEDRRKLDYAKPLAQALYDTTCADEALTKKTRARLQRLVRTRE